MSKPKYIQIESKNAILELLREGRHFERIYLANNAYKDDKTREIVKLAGQKKIEVLKVSRRILNRRLRTSASESVIGYMLSENHWKLDDLLDRLSEEGKQPFFLILDNLKYTQNIAAIMRSAFGAGVNGIIVNPQEKSLVSNETIRISMGAAERIPLVEVSLFEAVKKLHKEDIKIYGVHMDGSTYFETDLTGPVALVLGAEDVGISHGILDKIDGTVSILCVKVLDL